MQPQDATRIQLHSFIMNLVEGWNRDRAQNPEGVPSATEVTRTIWDAEETNRLAVVSDSANSLTLADLLKEQAIEYFGGHQWREMEDYINHLSRKQRHEMNLRDFVGIFYDVLRGFGAPDDAAETEPDAPLGRFRSGREAHLRCPSAALRQRGLDAHRGSGATRLRDYSGGN